MLMLLVVCVLLGLAMLFGAIATLLLVPPDFVATACRPGDPPARRARPRPPRRAAIPAPTERPAA